MDLLFQWRTATTFNELMEPAGALIRCLLGGGAVRHEPRQDWRRDVGPTVLSCFEKGTNVEYDIGAVYRVLLSPDCAFARWRRIEAKAYRICTDIASSRQRCLRREKIDRPVLCARHVKLRWQPPGIPDNPIHGPNRVYADRQEQGNT